MPEFTGLEPYTTWDGAFTAEELDAIVAYGDALRQAEATVLDSAVDGQNNSFRNTRISWIEQSQETLVISKIGGRNVEYQPAGL